VQWWRTENPEKAALYNLARRVKHEPRPCTECGERFVPGGSDAEMCNDLCRLAPVAPPEEGGGVRLVPQYATWFVGPVRKGLGAYR
jgi:hypothetical protein